MSPKLTNDEWQVVRASYLKWSETGGPEEDFVNTGLGEAQVRPKLCSKAGIPEVYFPVEMRLFKL